MTLHERLRQAILSLELAPGERLSERGLEPAFGASRTPIRSALLRLESEGLVRRDAKGWTVAPIDVDELRALGEYRAVLETASVRLATERASGDDLEALADLARSADAAGTPEHSLDTGTSFHLELARLSGNDFLFAAMDGVMTRLYRTRWLEVQSAESRDRALHEHERLTDAMIARDAASAELAALEHLRGNGERMLAFLDSSRLRLRANGIPVAGG
jgi:DNA-binding GntR family transcriptional regulator